jgi:hypothetical protein
MKRWFAMAGLLVVLLIAGTAVGDDTPAAGKGKKGAKGGQGLEAIFKKMDTNGDGYISLEEFKKAIESRPKGKLKDNPEMIEKVFKRMDANGDGKISFEEFKKAREQMAERMKEGKGKKPGEDKP